MSGPPPPSYEQSVFGQSTNQRPVFGQSSQPPVFGQPANQSSVFGQTASQHSGFGQSVTSQPSVFGQTAIQHSGFGQSAISQPSVFGQTASQPSGFGQSAISQPSSFGQSINQPSGFGQSATSQPSVFGQPSGQSSNQSSVFGQSTTLFGQPTTTQASVFGQPSSQPSGFGQSTTLFGQPTTTQASVFGQPSSQPSGFGQSAINQPSGFGQTTSQPSVFGQTTNQSSGFGQTTTSQPSLFGQPSSNTTSLSSQTTTSQTSLLGQPTASPPSSFGKPTTQSSLFGKSTSQASVFRQPSTGPLPQTTSSQQSMLGTSTSSTQPSLFGKPNEPITKSPLRQTASGFGLAPSAFSQPGSSKFGSQAFGQNSSTTTTTSTSSSSGLKSATGFGPGLSSAKTLFGKPVTGQATSDTSGQTTVSSSSSDADSALLSTKPFGVVSSTGTHFNPSADQQKKGVLFGKPGVKTDFVRQPKDESKRVFRKKPDTKSTAGSSAEGDHGGEGSNSTRQLFGKPVNAEDSAEGDESMKGRKGFRTEGRLFGKAMPIKRLGRISESESGNDRTSQDSDRGPRTPMQRQLSEDMTRKVTIVCKPVPTKFNNQSSLKQHFRRFGQVTKVFPNVNKMQATIHFKTHEEASKAKHRGRVLGRGIPPMSIFWSSYMLPPSPTEASARQVGDRPFSSRPGANQAERTRRPPWKHPDDVNNELSSMAGTQDLARHRPISPKPLLAGTQDRPRRAPSPAPSSSLDIKTEKVSLNQLNGMVARNTPDRVQILNLRDKYFRQNKKKATNVDAKAFVGTCKDMCPEKERYDREDKRRLSCYEIVPGTENIPGKNPVVDHSRAVKEYLRSSPDQDEPLPHELRPLPVLQKTMTYLLKEVANQGEDGRWGDWFDFLWNRTRGIRKDITQQQFCDRNAAELIEKCARFHVFCSERLCEEDMHSFDAKINNENLTKCLQTLKEFYTDLEKKQKVFCHCEAEFRAYTILMNLNEGDTLREVQKLRHDVRSSSNVRFALDVYFALSNNNYIKFFRLLKNALFANACIMHRYFPQVRIKALLSMMRGYSPGSKPAQIPLAELVKLLAFESMAEAAGFCSHYGFETLGDDVVLDRNKYAAPETAWAEVRSRNYIESKLMVAAGEMMNGDSFSPDYQIPTPHSSFDHNDRFIFEGRAVDQDVNQQEFKQPMPIQQPQFAIKPDPEPGPSLQPVKQQPAPITIPPEFIKDTARVLFWEVIKEVVSQLAEETMTVVNHQLEETSQYVDKEIRAHVDEEAEEIVTEVINELNEEKLRREAEELKQRKEKVSHELVDGLLYDVLHHETRDIAKIQYREVLAELKRERIERVTAEISEETCKDVSESMAKEIAVEVFETDVTQRLREMEKAEEAVKLLRTRRYLEMWKKYHRYVMKLKRAFTEFPATASMDSLEVQNAKLTGHKDNKIVNQQFLVGTTAMLTIKSPLEIMKQREANEYKCAMLSLKRTMQSVSAWEAEDIMHLVQKILLQKVDKRETDGQSFNVHQHWKMLICLPEVPADRPKTVGEMATKILCDWFTRKYSVGSPPSYLNYEKSNVLTLSKSSHSFEGKNKTRGLCHLGVCVRTVEGCLSTEDIEVMTDERTFLGTSGMIFVLPAPVVSMTRPDSKYWSENRQRLRNVLEASSAVQAISLVIFMALDPADFGKHESFSSVSDHLQLEDLIDENFFFDYHFVEIKYDPTLYSGVQVTDTEFYKKVCEGIEWIADRSLPPPSLKVSTLRDFIDKILLTYFYPPMLQNLKQRRKNGYLERDPNSILELYNSVIDHARYVLTLPSLSDISWPVPEFVSSDLCAVPAKHWNTMEYMGHLEEILDYCRLPEFNISNPDTDSWNDAKHDVRTYFEELQVKSAVIWGNLNCLFKQVEGDFEKKCLESKGEVGCQPFYVHLPFSQIISLCIEHKMETVDFRDGQLAGPTMGCVPELRVAYAQKEMETFELPVAWRHQESEESFKSSPSLEQTLVVAAYKQANERSKRKTKRNIVVDTPDSLSDCKKMANDLLRAARQTTSEMENSYKHFQEELAKGEFDLGSYGNLSKIEWSQGQGSCRRKSDGGLRRKSVEYETGVKEKRPRKRYSEIGIPKDTFPLLSMEEDMLNLQKDVKKLHGEYTTDYERLKLDIEYNDILLRRFSRDKLTNEKF